MRHTLYSGLMAAALCLGMGLPGCGGCRTEPAPPAPAVNDATQSAAAAQSPPSPFFVPAADAAPEAAAPEQAPAQTPSTAAPTPAATGYAITEDVVEYIQEGMTVEEVAGIMGQAGVVIARNGTTSELFRWSKGDRSFLLRFENGVLMRKTPLKGGQNAVGAPAAQLDQGVYDQVREGMPLEEVLALVNLPSQTVIDDGERVSVFRWTDSAGSSFTARFENNVLVRKTGFVVAPLAEEEKRDPASETAAETAAAPEEGAGEAPLVQVAEAPEPEVPAAQAAAPGSTPRDAGGPQVSSPDPPSRVRVVGGERRAREAETSDDPNLNRSYKPKAKLPDYTRSLGRGTYEIRVVNPTSSTLRVGIRTGKNGKDLRVPAQGDASLFVEQGAYSFSYIYDDEPHSLYRGGTIRIDGAYTADVEVQLTREDYDVRHLESTGASQRRR